MFFPTLSPLWVWIEGILHILVLSNKLKTLYTLSKYDFGLYLNWNKYSNQHVLSLKQMNILMVDKVRLNGLTDKLYVKLKKIKHNDHLTNNFQYTWSKGDTLRTKRHPSLEELKESCGTFMTNILNLEYDDKSVSTRDFECVQTFNEDQNMTFSHISFSTYVHM